MQKPQLNSDTEDEELEDKVPSFACFSLVSSFVSSDPLINFHVASAFLSQKPHLKSDSEEDENFGKPAKKRKRAVRSHFPLDENERVLVPI